MARAETMAVSRAGWTAAASIGLCLVAGSAAGAPPDLEQRCRTITAFDYEPTAKELKEALAQAGSRGRTRLDLQTSLIPLAAPSSSDDPEFGPPRMMALPKWKKPLDAARAIAAAKTMAGVRELVLDQFPLTTEAARILAASKHVAGLESLSLARTGLTGAALHELLAPGAFAGLVEMDLTNNRLKAADLEELAARLAERKIRRLSMGARDTGLPDVPERRLPHDAAAIEALAHIAAVPSLATLDLNDERIGAADLEALLKVPRTQPLEIGIATFPKLGDKQLAALAALDPEGHVSFAIAALGSKVATLRALDKSGLLAKVTSLELSCGDACARIIAGSKNVGRLRELVFACEAGVPFTKATAVALSRATGLGGLRELALLNVAELCEGPEGIGVEGLRALLVAPFAGQLEALTFDEQDLNGAGYVALAKATSLGALKKLTAVENGPILTAANIGVLFRDGALASHLELLSLQNESAEGWPIAELAKGLKMPKLRVLQLPSAHGSLRDWLKLTRAPGWQPVRTLSISPEIEGDQVGRDQVVKELRAHMAPDACVLSP